MNSKLSLVGPIVCLLATSTLASAKDKKKNNESLTDYVIRVEETTKTPERRATVPGSLWEDTGSLANIASDYRARTVGDLIIVRIVEQTLAEASGSVASQRTFKTSSGVTGIAGRLNTTGVNPLLSANSDTQLKGQAQTASSSSLRTSISGQIVGILPNGNLIVEARRSVLMNNERQTIVLRGVARPGDLSSSNTVLSSQLSDLEVELRGKGAISETTRQPNWIVRALLRLVSF